MSLLLALAAFGLQGGPPPSGPLPRMYQHGAPFGFDYPADAALRATWDRMCASAPVIPEQIPDWFTFLRDAPREWDLP